jgi:transposase
VALTFGVSVASVVKWSQRFRATGSAAAFKVGGRRPYALAGERDWLLARIGATPDLTLRAIVAELAERGIRVSYFAVWHFFEHEGISFKKKPARQRARSGRRRAPARAVEEVSGQA